MSLSYVFILLVGPMAVADLSPPVEPAAPPAAAPQLAPPVPPAPPAAPTPPAQPSLPAPPDVPSAATPTQPAAPVAPAPESPPDTPHEISAPAEPSASPPAAASEPFTEMQADGIVFRRPNTVHDGQLMVAQLRLEAGEVAQCVVAWQGGSYKALPSKNGWLHALVPVSLRIKPGPAKLSCDCAGKKASFEVTVSAATYPESKLTVDPKFTSAPPPRVVPEKAAIEAAFSKSEPRRSWRDGFVHPVPGVTTSPFGVRRTYNGSLKGRHLGLDFDGKVEDPLVASNDGVVALAAQDFFFVGNAVFIDHGERLFTMYFHMTRLQVKTGDRVKRGQVIGNLGATGRVTGPHVHFAVKLAGTYVDPLSLLTYEP